MKSLLKLVSLLVLFLVMSGGQTILMVNQADAGCCNMVSPQQPCTRWFSTPVNGSVKLKKKDTDDYTVLIQDSHGYFLYAKPSPLIINQFQSEHMTEAHGIGILTWENDELVLTAFVLSNPEDHGKLKQSPTKVVQGYSKLFQQAAQDLLQTTTKHRKLP